MPDYLPTPAPVTVAGREISPIAWGMWRFAGADLRAARARVDAAFEAGVTLFDTADIYGADTPGGFGSAEALLGDVFAEAPGLRERMVLATKGGIIPGVPYDSSASYLASAIDMSLRRLRTDHVELWQIHRPDLLAHPQEIARVLEEAHRMGKIGAVGVSNFTPSQTSALAKFLPVPVISHQSEFSPLHLAPLFDGIFDQSMAEGMRFFAWSPLGGGRLGDPADARGQAVVALLDAKAAEFGVSRASATYSWVMAHSARPIPIVGTQTIERIRDIPHAFTPRWTRAEWYAVLQTSMGERLP
ncbi:Aldo/keto reductase [Sphingopyxis sp. LC81]|uniref:aldo/keto reductase n=1 Tax=Sphingopyxis sp. LC81 TaxID=1502850 RepID=UPI0005100B21|nr:aldo/keto reductase [Sphingopyxis sp. LC81]KGB56256.1 Aldo/keto reductase [Sphingopyxis sp. LC81]